MMNNLIDHYVYYCYQKQMIKRNRSFSGSEVWKNEKSRIDRRGEIQTAITLDRVTDEPSSAGKE